MYVELVLFLVTLTLVRCFFQRCQKRNNKNLPPGPIGLPIFGYLPFLGKVPCLTVTSLIPKFGNIFTLQLGKYPVVFVNDFETIKELYKLDVMTGRAQLEVFQQRGYYGIGLLEGNDWSEVRRFMMRCLREFGFGTKSMEASILEQVTQCTQFIGKNVGKPVDLKPVLEIAVINALWEIFTGEKYNIEDPLKRKVANILSEGLASQNLVGIASFLPWLAKLLPGFSGYAQGMEYFEAPEDLVREIMDKHIATYDPTNHRDFVDCGLGKVYSTTNPQSQFFQQRGLKNVHYTVLDMFFAGSDTLSSTLGWTFLFLAMWPEVQKKIHCEIDTVLENHMPCAEDRQRLPYVEATMAEVMRKSTITPFGLFHAPIEDFEFGGYSFPKGTFFLNNLYHIHHDPQYWGDPHAFRPERFIDPFGKFRRDERLIPFFIGRRTCPAQNLALQEYFLFFVGILQQFSFTLDPNQPKPDIGPRSGFILTPPKHDLYALRRPTQFKSRG